MKKQLLFILILIPVLNFAQNEFNISGVIKNVHGSSLDFVNVLLSKKYDVSDDKGQYNISNVKKGEYTISISSIGFKTINKKIIVNKNLTLNFTLQEEAESLDNVFITAKKESTKQEEKSITIGSFEIKDVIATTTVITEQIDQISGVRVRTSGALGADANISVNGLTGTSIRQYIDGIPLEFLYPGLSIATIPIGSVKRVDVYKGVVPVDVGTDALGGAINLITGDVTKNSATFNYSIGSFGTLVSNLNLTLADDKHNYISANGGVGYSDNNYTLDAKVNTLNPDGLNIDQEIKEVEMFHNQYKLESINVAIGTSKKKWTDKAKLSLTYLNAYQEVQHGATVTDKPAGEAFNTSENFSATLLYDKTILEDKLKIKTTSNFGLENTKALDSTSNQYNWLGDIIRIKGGNGEISGQVTKTKAEAYINRSSIFYDINETNRFLLSNLIALRRSTNTLFDFDDNKFSDRPENEMIKNIGGLQYEGGYFEDKLKVTAAAKYYTFDLALLDDANGELIDVGDDFYGWNASFKYNILPKFAIRGSYEKGFLIPELAQYIGDPTSLTQRNILLKPEKSDNFNLGLLYSHTFNENYSLIATTSAFLRKVQDNIYSLISGATTQAKNAEDIDAKGFEADVKLTFLKNFKLNTNVSYTEKIFADAEDKSIIGTPFPNTPSLIYNTRLSWSKERIFKRKIDFSIYGAFNHVDAFNYKIVGASNTIEGSPDQFISERNKFDTGFSLQFLNKQLTTAFNIVNLTNKDLFDNYSIPLPGRSYNFKLIYKLTKF